MMGGFGPLSFMNYEELWNEAVLKTGIKNKLPKKERFKNLLNWFLSVKDLDGLVAECGTWVGTSAYILSEYTELHCFDSFQGFECHGEVKFSINVDVVKKNLSGRSVVIHQGLIPEVFKESPDGQYKFVHVDVDKYQPTKDSFDFFIPKLCPGGMIVCDDYNWVGDAQKAVDEYGIFKIKGTQAIYKNDLDFRRSK